MKVIDYFTINKKFMLWVLVILWMGIIYYLSGQTAVESSSLSGQTIRALAGAIFPEFNELSSLEQKEIVAGLQSVVRDAAHVLTYFILGILTMAAIATRPWALRTKVTSALAICTIYAIADELHQVFVDGRAFELLDIGLDFCGIAAGTAIMLWIGESWKAEGEKREG